MIQYQFTYHYRLPHVRGGYGYCVEIRLHHDPEVDVQDVFRTLWFDKDVDPYLPAVLL